MIRDAKIEDAKALLDIYSYYVENTAISFEIETPCLDEFKMRIRNILNKYPYIVFENDVGDIKGYAYAHEFGKRKAYDISVELSIYVDKDVKMQGIGKKLYAELEHRLIKAGYKNLYALVAYPSGETKYLTTNSYDFHLHMGFNEVGHLHRCGKKFDEYFDMIYMEKIIDY